MYRLRVKTDFDAAHWLDDYEGKCSNLHGHLWIVEVFILGEKLDKAGMVMDFGDIKAALKGIVDELDHTCLNDTREIGNPTSEHIAKYIYEYMKPKIPATNILEKVRIWENPRSWCEYFEVGI